MLVLLNFFYVPLLQFDESYEPYLRKRYCMIKRITLRFQSEFNKNKDLSLAPFKFMYPLMPIKEPLGVTRAQN